jgi:hypothetical protein
MNRSIRVIVSRRIVVSAVLAVAVLGTPAAHAALTSSSTLSQQITAGVLSTSIRDAAGVVVASPSFSMGSVVASTASQTATGTFGSNTQRITVDNPGGANNGWVLSLAATGGATATWTSGGSTYAFNGTTATGQLTINPSVSTITPASGNTATGIAKGTSATFSVAVPITLITAALASEDVWNGYVTGIGVSQLIPASQPVGTYTIDLTQTVVAS